MTPRLGAAAFGAATVLLCSAAAAAAVVTDDPTGSGTPSSSSDPGGKGSDGRGQGEGRTGGVGPDAAGPAHHGLCTAWSHVRDTPGRAAQSPAFRNLQEAGCEDGAATRGDEKKKEKDEATSPGQGRPDNPGRGHAKDRSKAKDKNGDGDDSGDDSGDQGGDATED